MRLKARSYKRENKINFKFRCEATRKEINIDNINKFKKTKNIYITLPSGWSVKKILLLASQYYLIDKKVYLL